MFSSFKRRFGDSVMARIMKNIINEIGIKVRTYTDWNMFAIVSVKTR